MWIVNHIPWFQGGVDQCICTKIVDPDTTETVYPINYEWIDNLIYVGRELLGIEYINTVETVDHWIYGPHHLWSYPETGTVVRMYQPFNGLQVYPDGVGKCEKHLFI